MAAASATCMMQFGTGNAEIYKMYRFEFQASRKIRKENYHSNGVLSSRGKHCSMCLEH